MSPCPHACSKKAPAGTRLGEASSLQGSEIRPFTEVRGTRPCSPWGARGVLERRPPDVGDVVGVGPLAESPGLPIVHPNLSRIQTEDERGAKVGSLLRSVTQHIRLVENRSSGVRAMGRDKDGIPPSVGEPALAPFVSATCKIPTTLQSSLGRSSRALGGKHGYRDLGRRNAREA